MIKKVIHFITHDIWMIDVKDYPPVLGFFLRQLRIVLLATKEFRDNHIQLRASALTYYSLLSVVPIAALVFGIAKGFGFETRLETMTNCTFIDCTGSPPRKDVTVVADGEIAALKPGTYKEPAGEGEHVFGP